MIGENTTIEDLDFDKLTVAQVATIVRKVYNSSKREQVLRRVNPNIIKPHNVHLFLNPEEFFEVQEIFQAIDVDNSETIDFAEIKEGFEAMEVDLQDDELLAMTIEFDKSEEDVMDFREFAALLMRIKITLAKNKSLTKENERSRIGKCFTFYVPFLDVWLNNVSGFRRRAWDLFDNPSSSRAAQVISMIILSLIITSCVLFMLESTPYFQANDELMIDLDIFEEVSVYVFTIEFVSRLLSCPRLVDFLLSAMNWIDLIAILPFYIETFVLTAAQSSGSSSLRVVRLVRIFRVLKIGRYLRWIGVFVATIEMSLFPLGMVLFIIIIGLVTFSSGLYYAERSAAVEEFESIPGTFWFTMSTVTSVGYGDMVPHLSLGKFFSALAAIFGILVLAIPISVISSNFRYEFDKMKTRQEIEQEQAMKSNLSAADVEKEMRTNKHLTKVISNTKKFSMPISTDPNLPEHQLFATAAYKSCRTNQKRILQEMKHRERSNRHFMIENLFAVQDEYLSTRSINKVFIGGKVKRSHTIINRLVPLLHEERMNEI